VEIIKSHLSVQEKFSQIGLDESHFPKNLFVLFQRLWKKSLHHINFVKIRLMRHIVICLTLFTTPVQQISFMGISLL